MFLLFVLLYTRNWHIQSETNNSCVFGFMDLRTFLYNKYSLCTDLIVVGAVHVLFCKLVQTVLIRYKSLQRRSGIEEVGEKGTAGLLSNISGGFVKNYHCVN